MLLGDLENSVFEIQSQEDFENVSFEVFKYQYLKNPVYRTFCDYLNRNPSNTDQIASIPCLPIEFFKSKKITTGRVEEIIFSSSGTTGRKTSKHYVANLELYQKSFKKGFQLFYGDPKDYCILALLPSYLEREGSSLIFMVDELMKQSNHPENGYFLYDFDLLKDKLVHLESTKQKTLLIGVSFALLDFAQNHSLPLKNTIIMETGGMKGRKKEMTRQELHQVLKEAFGVPSIHSEYGMTELLSQAYSQGNGVFRTPPWMRIYTRDTEDPLTIQKIGKTGGINVIDLANLYSCSFIATQDLGKTFTNGTFEVLGRFDNADIRGCNLMAL